MINRHIGKVATGCCVALAMTFTGGVVSAASGEHPGTPEEELRYKGAPVPIDPESARETLSPKAPAISPSEFARAANLGIEALAAQQLDDVDRARRALAAGACDGLPVTSPSPIP